MNVVVINGTDRKGITWHMKNAFLAGLGEGVEVTEFTLPAQCPPFCTGCMQCIEQSADACPHAEKVAPVREALDVSDLIVLASPVYVLHAPGHMKTLLDHLAYRWMPHRPAEAMFSKRAVVITQCMGAGARSAARDMADSLRWWGISDVQIVTGRAMTAAYWDELPDVRRKMLEKRALRAGRRMRTALGRPVRAGLGIRMRFMFCRMLQKRLYAEGMCSEDSIYWHRMGWLGRERPWRTTQ